MKFNIEACTNMARACLKGGVEDYESLVQKGAMSELYTMTFFQSEEFHMLCAIAEVSEDKVLEYIHAVEIAETPRAKILNWIFDRKHFNEHNARIVFTSPEKIKKVIEQSSRHAELENDDFKKGMYYAIDKFVEDIFDNKFIQKTFYCKNIKTKCCYYKKNVVYACNDIFNLPNIHHVTKKMKETVLDAVENGTVINDEWMVEYKYFMQPTRQTNAVQEGDEFELDES